MPSMDVRNMLTGGSKHIHGHRLKQDLRVELVASAPKNGSIAHACRLENLSQPTNFMVEQQIDWETRKQIVR